MNTSGQDTQPRDQAWTHPDRPTTAAPVDVAAARPDPPAPGSSVASEVAQDTHRQDTSWRRLDRRMLLIRPVEAVKDFLPYIVVFLFAGASQHDGPWWTNLLVVLVPILIGVWSWATTSYRITADQLVLRRGIVQRTTLTARLDRVRTVDVTASPLQRLLGVASVEIGTGAESPFKLDGLSAADAAALRSELLHVALGTRTGGEDGDPGGGDDGPLDAETTLGAFSPAWIGYAPFSLTGLLAVLAVVGFAAQFVDDVGRQILDSDVGHAVLDHVLALSAAAAVLQGIALAVVLLTLASVVTYVLQYWGYRLTRHPRGTLAVSRGLLTTRSTTIEERRLRGVTVTRPLLLRLVKAARADALVTGLTDSASSTSTSSDLLTPPAPAREVARIVATVLRDPAPLAASLRRHGPAARRRRHVRALAGSVVVAAVSTAAIRWFELSPWLYLVPAVLVALAPVTAEARYRCLGHALVSGHLVSRVGPFPERTTIVLTSAVIGWNIVETPFQRRVGLVTLVATIAAGDDDAVEIPDIPLADAEALVRATTPGLAEPFMTPICGRNVRPRSGTTCADASRPAG